MTSPRDDLVLRSFLAQPLILYAHHLDLAMGLDVLGEAAAFVNQEEGVRWGPSSDIARSSFVTRHDGTILRVRIYARRIELDVPDGRGGDHRRAPALPRRARERDHLACVGAYHASSALSGRSCRSVRSRFTRTSRDLTQPRRRRGRFSDPHAATSTSAGTSTSGDRGPGSPHTRREEAPWQRCRHLDRMRRPHEWLTRTVDDLPSDG